MQAIDRMIQFLQGLQQQKHMFLYPLETVSLENFLNGFRAACASCGHEIPRKLRAQVIEGRGWKHSAAGPAPQMKAKGMTDEAIQNEMIEIEIAQLRELAKLKK